MEVIAILICLFLIVRVQRSIYQKQWDKNLEVDVHFQNNNIMENEIVRLEVVVSNKKRLPLPALSVAFSLPKEFVEHRSKKRNLVDTFNRNELFSVLSNQSVTRTLFFKCKRRGIYKIKDLQIVNRSLFLDREDTWLLPMERQIMVCPTCVNMRNFVKTFQNLFGEILSSDFRNEDVFLVRSIRKYQSFDNQRTINWKATAKLGELMVNNYEYTNNRKVVIFLNLSNNQLSQDMDYAEESIRLAKTWCVNLSRYGIESDLYTNGQKEAEGEVLFVEASKLTKKYLTQVDETLARIDCCKEQESFFDIHKEKIEGHIKDCFFIFISSYQREDFQEGLLRLAKKTKNFVWIVPKSATSAYQPRLELKKKTIGWNVYWRREEDSEAIGF